MNNLNNTHTFISSPEENIYVVGTVNQVAHPDISFKAMIKLTRVVTKK